MSPRPADDDLPKAMAEVAISGTAQLANLPLNVPNNPAEAKPDHACTICGEKAELVCQNCMATYYCCATCQATDWKLHKLLCRSLKKFKTPPSPDMRRGILFKWDSEKPEFVWLEPAKMKAGGKLKSAQISELIGHPKETIRVISNCVRDRNLMDSGATVMLAREAVFQPVVTAILRENKSLQNAILTGSIWIRQNPTNSGIFPTGYGPYGTYLLMAMRDHEHVEMRNATLADFRTIIDLLSSDAMISDVRKMVEFVYQDGSENVDSYENAMYMVETLECDKEVVVPARAEKLQGVRVTCREDGGLVYKPILFPRDHPFLLSANVFPRLSDKHKYCSMDVPSAIELPLAWIRNPDDSALETNPDAKPLSDCVRNIRDGLLAEFLVDYFRIEPLPKKQLDVTFLRVDFKHLPVEHMRAICEFTRDRMPPFQNGHITKAEYTTVATKSTFQIYFNDCMKKHGWPKTVVSPYEIEGVTPSVHQEPKGVFNGCECKSRYCFHKIFIMMAHCTINEEDKKLARARMVWGANRN